ncbi:hypothetical protein ACS0TY_005312 [Phlomoides rotata]
MIARMLGQASHLNKLYLLRDADCLPNLRMDRNTFARLCILLRDLGGLTNQKYVGVEEQVSKFLSVLAHHKKQSVVKFDYQRSGQTVSRYTHLVLKAVSKLNLFLVTPTPVPDNLVNPRWKWFKIRRFSRTTVSVLEGIQDLKICLKVFFKLLKILLKNSECFSRLCRFEDSLEEQ